ncbi:MAG: hypothetical protein HY092_03935 [Candidatus Kerfeldbacteria bacterium]|nr:hypothetical protein [Candidatus Kerfeldbacteria bacterium]
MSLLHSIRFISSSLFRRPWLVTTVLLVGIVGLMAWQGYRYSHEQPVPLDLLRARKLRVKTTQLNSLLSNLETYRQPSPAAPVLVSPFVGSTQH